MKNILLKLHNLVEKKPIIVNIIIAFLLNIFIETCARQSVLGGFKFMVSSPVVFFYNVIIIWAVIMISELWKRKYFALILLSLAWVMLGVVNGIILSNRMTPFTVYDIQSLKDGLSIATNYLSTLQIIGIVLGILLVIFLIVVLWLKAPKRIRKNGFKKGLLSLAIAGAICGAASYAAVEAKMVDTYFPNLAYGYRDNGVPYCFINTWLNTGVGRPYGYGAEQINDIFSDKEKEQIQPNKTIATKDRPNIIFVQLESLMDPLTLKDIKLSEDPIPNLRKLYEEGSSGRLKVPSVGAGTANVEFESMTGMSVNFFGPGEYPYKNILLEKTCESIPYNLKSIGYKTHAIHNHRGVFYGRNKVFPNLGFDTFTSLEYLTNVSKTPKNWARDNVLVGAIDDALNLTKERDYIYTISVQGHGKYPTEEVIENPKITVLQAPTTALKWQYEYYANQIKEMDDFVKDLTDNLAKRDEKTVVVFYGDHLPAIENISESVLKDGRSIYQTDYCIWANFDMETIKQDMTVYQIGAVLLDRLGIYGGTITTLHQNHMSDKNYLEELHELQYDMLYGDKYIYGGINPWEKTKMKMGIKEIKATSVVHIGDKYYLKGENFTEYSKLTLDDKILETEYLGPTVLLLEEEVDEKDIDKIKISQVDDVEILSTSE